MSTREKNRDFQDTDEQTGSSEEQPKQRSKKSKKTKSSKRKQQSSGGGGPLDKLPVGGLGGDQLPVGGVGDVGNTVGGVTDTLGGVTGGLTGGGGGDDGKDTLRLRLDLNLDIEIQLKARIHGDLELALLYVVISFLPLVINIFLFPPFPTLDFILAFVSYLAFKPPAPDNKHNWTGLIATKVLFFISEANGVPCLIAETRKRRAFVLFSVCHCCVFSLLDVI